MDWMRAGAAYYGFRIGVPIAIVAVISGIDERVNGGGLKDFVGDATGISYEDIDLSLTLIDAAILALIIGLGPRVARKLRTRKNEERDEFREIRDEQKKSK